MTRRKNRAPPSSNWADLAFVNVSHPDELKDAKKRRQAKRHVMTIAARSRKKPSRTFDLVWSPTSTVNAAAAHHPPSFPDAVLRAVMPSDGGAYPVILNSRTQWLVHFVRTESSRRRVAFRHAWHAIALSDATAFYLYLANAVLFSDGFVAGAVRAGLADESARYVGVCLRQVAERLADPAARVTGSVVGPVLGLACHDTCLKKWDRRSLHMSGLESLIGHRGGFEGLQNDLTLMISWFDVLEASFRDEVPRFPLFLGRPDEKLTLPASAELTPLQSALLLELGDPHASPVAHPVKNALERTIQLINFVRNEGSRDPEFWSKTSDAARLIMPVAYDLLSAPARLCRDAAIAASPARDITIELIRLALLATVAGLKEAFSLPADELAHLHERSATLLGEARRSHGTRPELWAVVMLHCAGDSPIATHVERIRRLMLDLGIQTWDKVLEVVKSFLWIDNVFDGKVALLSAAMHETACPAIEQ